MVSTLIYNWKFETPAHSSAVGETFLNATQVSQVSNTDKDTDTPCTIYTATQCGIYLYEYLEGHFLWKTYSFVCLITIFFIYESHYEPTTRSTQFFLIKNKSISFNARKKSLGKIIWIHILLCKYSRAVTKTIHFNSARDLLLYFWLL